MSLQLARLSELATQLHSYNFLVLIAMLLLLLNRRQVKNGTF